MSPVRLRPVSEADLPVFFEHQRDPEALRMAAFHSRDWDAFLQHWKRVMADPVAPVRTVTCDGNVAGYVVSWPSGEQQLVGFWIGRSYWGRGVATEALEEFLSIVRARPLHAYVARHNISSIRVLEKCAFVESEVLPAQPDGIEEVVMRLG